MRIAIFGAGAIGLGLAAYLSANGHDTPVVSLSGRGSGRFSGTPRLTAKGRVQGEIPVRFASPAEALKGADLAIVAQQVEGHSRAVSAIAEHLTGEQAVLINGALGFEGARLAELLARKGIDAAIGATPVPPINARMTGPTEVLVSRIKDTLEIFSAPAHAARLAAVLQPLLPIALTSLSPLMGADLNNINPIAHYANALCNFTRIENGENWLTYAGYTDRVAALIEALDAERAAIAACVGVTTRSTASYFAEWNSLPGKDLAEVSRHIVERGQSPNGPASISTRYIVEDVPYGLVTLEALGRKNGVNTPLFSAGIEIFSALLAIDFRAYSSQKSTMEALA